MKNRQLNEKVKNICNNFNKDSMLTYLYSVALLSHSNSVNIIKFCKFFQKCNCFSEKKVFEVPVGVEG